MTLIRRLRDINVPDFQVVCKDLETQVSEVLLKQGVKSFTVTFEVELRYHGQATNLPVLFSLEEVLNSGSQVLEQRWVPSLQGVKNAIQ